MARPLTVPATAHGSRPKAARRPQMGTEPDYSEDAGGCPESGFRTFVREGALILTERLGDRKMGIKSRFGPPFIYYAAVYAFRPGTVGARCPPAVYKIDG